MPHRPDQFGTPSRIGPYTHWPEGGGAGDHPPAEGCYLLTKTRCCHLVVGARSVAGNPNRLMLSCVRTDPEGLPDDACVHGLVYDSRQRNRP